MVDAETAKARALAQASLLSLKLPNTQVSPTDLAKRLYIGNLYYDLKEEDIRSTFAPFGAIHSIDLSLEPGYVFCIGCQYLQKTPRLMVRLCALPDVVSASRSKGFCFLEYEGAVFSNHITYLLKTRVKPCLTSCVACVALDVLAAESAVQVLNGTQLSNRTLRVGLIHIQYQISRLSLSVACCHAGRSGARTAEARIRGTRPRASASAKKPSKSTSFVELRAFGGSVGLV